MFTEVDKVKRFETKKIICVMMAALMLCSFAACKKKAEAEETEEADVTPTPIPVETTEVPATSLTVYEGPLPANSIEVTWTETELSEPTVMYAAVTQGEFLRVRQGPDTEYNIVGTLTRNQVVTVVAQTTTGWYKTSDGFYVSGNYLTSTPST